MILGVVGAVTQILVGVLGIHLHVVVILELGLIRCLHEEVAVPLAPHIDILIAQTAHDATRAAALAIIIIDVRRETTFEQSSLNTSVADVAVCPASHRIFILRVVTEGVVAPRVGPLTIKEATPSLSLELHIRLRHIGRERRTAQLYRQRVLRGSACTQVDSST